MTFSMKLDKLIFHKDQFVKSQQEWIERMQAVRDNGWSPPPTSNDETIMEAMYQTMDQTADE